MTDLLINVPHRPGTHRLACPHCNKGPRDKALAVTVKPDGSCVWLCHRCGWAGAQGVSHYQRVPRAGHRAPHPGPQHEPKIYERLSGHGRALWDACLPLKGTIGEAYLIARGCRLPPKDGDLRFHPKLKHPPTGYEGPALVALVTHAVTREPLTLHRTWIKSDGSKAAEADPPRLLLGRHRKAGGVIRLWPDECVGYGLGIAEGIETALALAHAMSPVWACIDAGNLSAFPALRGIESLMIAADHDKAGLKAATDCARRWRTSGAEVHVIRPPEGCDVADVARGGVL